MSLLSIIGLACLVFIPKISGYYISYIHVNGIFELGRFVDLYICDVVISLFVLIAVCEVKSWLWRRDK